GAPAAGGALAHHAAAAWAAWRQRQGAASGAAALPLAQPPHGAYAAASPWAAWSQAASTGGVSAGWPLFQDDSSAPATEISTAADGGCTGGTANQGPGKEEQANDPEVAMDSNALVARLHRQLWKQEEPQQQSQQSTGEPSPEDGYAKDLASAVQLFLAGGDEDEDDDEDEGSRPPAAEGCSVPAGGGNADRAAVARTTPPAEPRTPAAPASPAATTAAEPAADAAAQLGLPAAAPSPGPRPAGPSPEGVRAFLRVLRQRPLHPDITEERKAELEGLVFECVRALYGDRIRPALGTVQRRLRELLAVARWDRGPTEAAVQALLPMCARDPRFALDPPMHGSPPVLRLAEEPTSFRGWVDVDAQEDSYGQDMWGAFSEYLQDAGGQAPVSLPGPPHTAAQHLQRRQLPFFQGLSLREVEHIVRLAMGKRRLLCSVGDSLRAARTVQPGPRKSAAASKKDAKKGDIKTTEDLTLVLLAVVQRFPEGVPLNLLKQHIRTYTHRTLSEKDFKCNKLTDLFKLAPLRNIFPLAHVAHRNEVVIKQPRMAWIPSHLPTRSRWGTAVASGITNAGADLGFTPYPAQWGAIGEVPMQTPPGLLLDVGTGMPPTWGVTPPVGIFTASSNGMAGCPDGAWSRPW
ncbi:unnamed protein product, partial [Prorocentrum cordatum]